MFHSGNILEAATYIYVYVTSGLPCINCGCIELIHWV